MRTDLTASGLALVMTITLAACGGPPDVSGQRAGERQTKAVKEDGVDTVADVYAVNEEVSNDMPDLWSSDDYERDGAIAELLEAASPADDIYLLLTDPDHRVRQEVLDLLAESGDADHAVYAEAALVDPHPAVRDAAAEALEEIGIAGSINVIKKSQR